MKFRTKNLIKNIISAILVTLIMIVGFFSITGIVFNIVYIPAPVYSFSMYPTLNQDAPNLETAGDYAYLNKFADYSNNDIVIANVSWYDKAIIKRLIACPNDILEIRDENTNYVLYVNEKLVYKKEKNDNCSLHNGLHSSSGTNGYYQHYLTMLEKNPSKVVEDSNGNKCFKLDKNEYFLMGDHWEGSTDCIEKGPVSKDEILGKVDFVIPMKENRFWGMLKHMVTTIFKI